MLRRAARAGAVVAALALSGPAAATASPLRPFGHPCTARHGVRFCPTVDAAHRVASFDRVPLDADVTLPPRGQGPFPTIAMLHGYGNSKTSFEATSAAGDGSETFHYNNVYYARHGYAVLTFTDRGFGGSCGGGPTGDHSGACGQGYIRLADTRYEARDVQYLLGLLADKGVAQPSALGVTGISYGGGLSLELAFLRDRIRLRNGRFQPWRSPRGKRLRIAAAYARWPWSDLVDSLLPNGRFLDTEVAPRDQSLRPVGVPIQSYVAGLYALGQTNGYYCGGAPASFPCQNRAADLTKDLAEVNAGEPYSADALAALQGIYDHSQAYGLSGRPSPLLIENGWTDDLFPPEQAIRIYNKVRARYPGAPVSLQFGDLGHSRGSNKPRVDHAFNDAATAFFAARLRHVGRGPRPSSVEAFIQTCPKSAPDGGPYFGSTYRRLHTGSTSFGARAAQTVSSSGGNPQIAAAFDPIANSDACKTVGAEDDSGTAIYKHVVRRAFTMVGLPTVRARIATVGQFGQLDARLWDVTPAGQQRLITRGVYRLTDNQTGRVTFQLHGNGYRFAAGHTVKLELLGRDAPYYRASNGVFSVAVSDLSVRLPIAAASRLHLSVRPRRVTAGTRRRFSFTVTAPNALRTAAPVSAALVRFHGRRAHTNRHGHASVSVRLARVRRYTARATKAGYRAGTSSVRARRVRHVTTRRAQARRPPRFAG